MKEGNVSLWSFKLSLFLSLGVSEEYKSNVCLGLSQSSSSPLGKKKTKTLNFKQARVLSVHKLDQKPLTGETCWKNTLNLASGEGAFGNRSKVGEDE